MVKKKISWEIYLMSGIITLIVLGAGIFFGMFLSGEKVKFLQSELERVRVSQEDTALQLVLLQQFPGKSCEIMRERFFDLQMRAAKLGGKLEDYERTEKMKAPEFFDMKKTYTITLLHYWYTARRLKTECHQKLITILYFYSNDYCPDCPKQGAALRYLKTKYPEQVMVFAIDSVLERELGSVKLLKSGYNVTVVPTLVIDDELYEGLVTANELESICLKRNVCYSS